MSDQRFREIERALFAGPTVEPTVELALAWLTEHCRAGIWPQLRPEPGCLLKKAPLLWRIRKSDQSIFSHCWPKWDNRPQPNGFDGTWWCLLQSKPREEWKFDASGNVVGMIDVPVIRIYPSTDFGVPHPQHFNSPAMPPAPHDPDLMISWLAERAVEVSLPKPGLPTPIRSRKAART